MIVLRDVYKTYKTRDMETKAINGISLQIPTGEWLAVMGTSGSGKSTLLHILGCMDFADRGEYFLDDLAIHQMSAKRMHEIRKQRISFIFQDFALMNQYTIYENTELPLKIKNIPKKKRKEQVLQILGEIGIEDLASKLPGQVSGGQKQRCAIARALASGNDIILADEPTGALDRRTGEEIMELFQKMHTMGKTIVMVTHDRRIASYAERIVYIEDGKLVDAKKMSTNDLK